MGAVLAFGLAAAPALAAMPSQAMLHAATNLAYQRFDHIYHQEGMGGLAEAVQGCYAKSPSGPGALVCLQMDYFAHMLDVGVTGQITSDPAKTASLRTPYFADDTYLDRRTHYVQAVAGRDAVRLAYALEALGASRVKSLLPQQS